MNLCVLTVIKITMDNFINYLYSVYGISTTFMLFIALICKGLKIPNFSLLISIFTVLFLTILFGLRDVQTGTDTITYLNWFKSLGSQYPTRDFEPLFTIIGRSVYFFTENDSWFFSLISLMTLFFLSITYKNLSHIFAVPLGLVMSVSFISGTDLITNGIRNGLALSIATYAAVKFLKNEKTIRFITIVILASLIHSSCFIFLIFIATKYIKAEKYVKIAFYFYLLVFILEAFKVFDFIFITISNLGIGSHIISRILAFKYQESDMFSGPVKYYFFVITIIPYILYAFRYNVDAKLITMHYILLLPFAMIFSSPSSYRFSYISFYVMIGIICQASLGSSIFKRLIIYTSILAMLIITYSTKTSMSYGNILFN